MAEPKAEINSGPAARKLDAAVESGVPLLYFNAVTIAASNSDVVVLLERNGKPVSIINMSFTMAKTLSLRLGQIIADIESRSGRPIMATSDIDEMYAPAKEEGKKE